MWFYEGKEFTDDMIQSYVGFVYEITHIPTGKSYVGKKLFTAAGVVQKKGKKKRIRKASDWKSYWGSNDYLRADVQALGEDQFERKILMLCQSKSELGYYELKFQIDKDVLLHPDKYYNAFLGYKVHRKNLIKGKKNENT